MRQLAIVTNNTDEAAWRPWANRIAAAWQKGVESIIETGKLVIDARNDAESNGWSWEALVQDRLPFSRSTAFKLMKIAENPVIVSHAKQVPPHWETLYELTKHTQDNPGLLLKNITSGKIHPKLQRKEVALLFPPKKTKKREHREEDEREEEIKEDPKNWETAFLLRADQAALFAFYDGPITDEIVNAARQTALAWTDLANRLSKGGLENG